MASNVTGFSALGGGMRIEPGLYQSLIGGYGNFWLSTEIDNEKGFAYYLTSLNPIGISGITYSLPIFKRYGLSIRCIRD
jgi:hypothetical protein